MDYSGKIKLFNKKFDYIIKDFEMTIVDSRGELLKKDKIKDIINKWLETEINEERKLIVKLSYKNINDNSIVMNIVAYAFILDLKIEREKTKDEIHKLTFRSDVLDFFYRPQKNYIKNVSNIISSFDNNKMLKGNNKKYEFNFNDKKFVLYFSINSYLTVYNQFMFDVFNSLNIECEDNITIDEVYQISFIVKKFLSFISNSRKVFLDKIIINGYFNEQSAYKYGEFYLEQGEKENIKWNNVFKYDNLKEKIGEIFNEIINDNICFVSLFQYEKEYISTIDIMNICAAFESQFDKTYPKYRNKKFNCVKDDILTDLDFFKSTYKRDKKSQEITNEIILAVKNYKDILRSKLEYALIDFEKLYNSKYGENMSIKYDFKDNYKEMPIRIKNARNKLDHGNTKVEINYDVLTDTILLRAVTYFMILKKAGIKRADIMKCIRIFTRFGV